MGGSGVGSSAARSGIGYDLDEETVKLFDSILVNIATDPELRQEFKKLQFIKTLEGKMPEGKGPIQQLLEKTAKIERDQLEQNMDLRRVITDLQHIARTVDKIAPPQKAIDQADRGIYDIDPAMKYNILQGKNE